MTAEQNKEVVREFFERFAATDVAGVLELLDDAVVWRAMGREGGMPMSGEMDKEAIGALVSRVRELIPGGLKLEPVGWTAEGNRVAVEMEGDGEMKSGKIYNNHYHFLAVVSGGKVTALHEYMDTLLAKQCFVDE